MIKIEYVRYPAPGVRYRVEFEKERGHVLGFVVQLELARADHWAPVVRYDTAHSFAHRDRYKYDGSFVKHEPMTGSIGEAFTFAVFDVRTNWRDWLAKYGVEP